MRSPSFLILAVAAGLAGCASTSFQPTEVGAFGMPYEGLNEASYGPRSVTQFRYCDPQDDLSNNPNLSPEGRAKVAEIASSIGIGVGQVLGKPIQGLTKIDSTLVTLGLADKVRVPSDSNHPLVAVLGYSEDSIVFWHSAKYVKPREVADAAQAFCAKRQKATLYRGSATRCPGAEQGLAGQAIRNTYAIAAFACTAR